jgi:hypothetical protein
MTPSEEELENLPKKQLTHTMMIQMTAKRGNLIILPTNLTRNLKHLF